MPILNLRYIIIKMWFMGKETVDRYDKFKAQIFGNKKDAFKQKQKLKRAAARLSEGPRPSNHPFFRKIIILSVLGTGFYFANQKFKILHQLSAYLQSLNFNPVYMSSMRALWSDLSRRFSTNPEHHTLSETKNSRFANNCFISEMNFYLKSVRERNVPKIITEETSSGASFGPFKLNCRHQRLRINQEGNVVRQGQKSKIRIGTLNIYGEKITQILEHQTTVSLFIKYREINMENGCKVANLVNRMVLPSEKYEKIYQECLVKSTDIYEELRRYADLCDQMEKRGQHKKGFLFSFS